MLIGFLRGGLGLASTLLTLVGTAGVISCPVAAEIITIGNQNHLPQLSEAEQAKLDTLLSTRLPMILSTISPDGSTLVLATVNRVSQEDWQVWFLDVASGELQQSLALDNEVFSPVLPIQWLDNTVLRFVQESLFGPWDIVTLNRQTEIVSHTAIYPSLPEEGEVLGVSPDFSKFVIRVFEGDEDVVYLVFLPSLDRLEVARFPDGMEIEPPAWSETGDRVALVMSSVEERRLYDRTPVSPNLANPVIQDALGRTPPEDNVFLQRSTLKVYDFTQAEPLQFEGHAEDSGDLFGQTAISPDGQRLLVKRYKPARVSGRQHPSYLFPQQSYYQVYTLQGDLLQTLDSPILQGPLENGGDFVDADTAIFFATVGTNRHLYVYDLATQQMRSLPLPAGVVDYDAWEVTPDGETVIYAFSSVNQPPEVFKIALDGQSPPQQLTDLNAEIAKINQVQVNPVQFDTRNGPREGILVQPQGAAFPPQAAPLVFWQQGGPGISMVNEFAVEVEMPLNLLPNFGLSVLLTPLAGREGLGPEAYRLHADGSNFGQVDILEGVDILNQVVRRGWSSFSQLGLTGCSYGGYYTSQMIARFPRLVAAANPQCSLLDAFTEWQLGYSSLLSYLVGQTPMEDPQRYAYLSPLYNAAAIRTPTLVFHGSEDFLQVDMARNFHDIIADNEVPVMMYEFQGVGHSLLSVDNQHLAAQLQIDFFRRYLRQQPSAHRQAD
ncbi:Dipeptidyl-peptidase 5 [Halomicronema hongdechloris C2206]|uniref:Dipeptidyl-peptidase 5 n=1 Tax=Halomicronema hongdechloris C2206 TaxID=1641165 RepID=A0A1Z3HS11_9CYAN|nr:prolyl oligopeptidase family serine peptidase [Halomicronema hongdechloris]ASC73101.1 Dipeptidyl-peptidase 5 [Halomicronema hongdechloris C2206]